MSRLEDRYKSVIHELVRRTLDLETWRRNVVAGDIPLFDIANEHAPATLSADQNNYDPGFYDVLRINAFLDVSITGISKGKKGRFLEFYNVSSYKISLPYESVLSIAANRIINSSGEEIVLFPTARVRLYYDSTISRWVIPDPPTWTGNIGMAMRARHSAGVQSIPNNTLTQLLIDTVNPGNDEWGIFDAPNNRAVIPTGMSGMWVGTLSGWWASHATGGNYRHIEWQVNGFTVVGSGVPSIASRDQWHPLSFTEVVIAGDVITWHVQQVSGGNLNYNWMYVHLARIR